MPEDQRFRIKRRGKDTRAVILRLTLPEYAEIEVLADEADIGVATVIKQLIRQALARGVIVVEEQQPGRSVHAEPAEHRADNAEDGGAVVAGHPEVGGGDDQRSEG